jgi:hypothetical protein
MKTLTLTKRMALTAGLALALASGAGSAPIEAHCDSLDGPVVRAAERALESRDVHRALIWIQPADEAEVRAAFAQALGVRTLGPTARQLADRHFFETLVRLHRAGEGASYTGLKPAGRDLGPAIVAADRALESGRANELENLLLSALRHGLHERYADVAGKQKFDPANLEAGRAYVASYVEYIHFVERLYEAATIASHGHYEEK